MTEGTGTFGERLRRYRIDKGMTQQALAEPHYTHAYVSSLEAGRRQASADAVNHFAAKLDVDRDELLTGRSPELAPGLEIRWHEARLALSAGRIDEAAHAFAAIGEEAARFDLMLLRGRAEYGIGACNEHAGRTEEAQACYERVETLLADQSHVTRTEAVAGQARCALMLGDTRYAIYLLELHQDSLIHGGLEDPTSMMVIAATLVMPYLSAGLLSKAAEIAAQALHLVPEVEDPARVAMMHVNVARSLLAERHYEDAIRSLRRAEDLYRQLDLQIELGIAHVALGYGLRRSGELSAARAELDTALRIFTATGSRANEARALSELASITREEGEVAAARALLERCVDLLSNQSDVQELALARRELGLCDLETDPEVAEKNLRSAIELFERAEEATQVAVTYGVLGDLFRNEGRLEESIEAYRTGIVGLERII